MGGRPLSKQWLYTLRCNRGYIPLVTLSTPPAGTGEWVLLSYRLLREPSTPRISLWRRLKRWGVIQVGDGLVALPAGARTREQLDWAAEEAIEAGGTAAVWLARPTAATQERALAAEMAAARAFEYDDLAMAAADALGLSGPEQTRTLRRLRRQWREITRRDFFPPKQRDSAAAALRALTSVTVVGGFGDGSRALAARSAGSSIGADAGGRS